MDVLKVVLLTDGMVFFDNIAARLQKKSPLSLRGRGTDAYGFSVPVEEFAINDIHHKHVYGRRKHR